VRLPRGGLRLLIALGIAALIVFAAGLAVLKSERSLIIIENRSEAPLNLSVEMVNPGPFSWEGELAPKRRVIRTARLSDNSFVVVCRNPDGIFRQRGGYVTSGMVQRIDIVATSCGSMRIDVQAIP